MEFRKQDMRKEEKLREAGGKNEEKTEEKTR